MTQSTQYCFTQLKYDDKNNNLKHDRLYWWLFPYAHVINPIDTFYIIPLCPVCNLFLYLISIIHDLVTQQTNEDLLKVRF